MVGGLGGGGGVVGGYFYVRKREGRALGGWHLICVFLLSLERGWWCRECGLNYLRAARSKAATLFSVLDFWINEKRKIDPGLEKYYVPSPVRGCCRAVLVSEVDDECVASTESTTIKVRNSLPQKTSQPTTPSKNHHFPSCRCCTTTTTFYHHAMPFSESLHNIDHTMLCARSQTKI